MLVLSKRSPGAGKFFLRAKVIETPITELHMNWDQIEGKWKQFVGEARQRWGRLTDSDWQIVAGKKDQLIGRVQERYGVAKAEAEKQADDWARTLAEEPAVKR